MRTDEGVLRCFDHVERMDWIDSVKEGLKYKRFGCQASKENGRNIVGTRDPGQGIVGQRS